MGFFGNVINALSNSYYTQKFDEYCEYLRSSGDNDMNGLMRNWRRDKTMQTILIMAMFACGRSTNLNSWISEYGLNDKKLWQDYLNMSDSGAQGYMKKQAENIVRQYCK